MNPYSLYLHIPFCRHRCAYCDFNTYAGEDELIPAYVSAICRELEFSGKRWQESNNSKLTVHTIFFGGGTPSLLPVDALNQIVEQARSAFDVEPEAEITMEANPGTVSERYLREARRSGINRLSYGVQSANPEELRMLEREHSYLEAVKAFRQARRAGFDNLNLDLIFGLPEQSLQSWRNTLELVLGLRPEHLSLYALTLEHGTPMAHWVERGLMKAPDPDLAADMYELASEVLEAAGYRQYEISNWAVTDQLGWRACRHNLQYWRGLPYLGLGAGAHGYAAGVRTANVLAPKAYIQRCLEGAQGVFPRTPATVQVETVTPEAELGETMMMGLRLVEEGVSAGVFAQRFGRSLQDIYGQQIAKFVRLGLLEWTEKEERLRLTRAGRLVGNQVFLEFLFDREQQEAG